MNSCRGHGRRRGVPPIDSRPDEALPASSPISSDQSCGARRPLTEDPLFPKAKVAPGDDLEFRPIGLDRAHWANANPVRTIFRDACARAGLPYFNPHSIRNTLVQLAYDRNLDAKHFKVWSQNLGHDNCLTTFSSYGEIPPAQQGEIMRGLAGQVVAPDAPKAHELLRQLADQLERNGMRC